MGTVNVRELRNHGGEVLDRVAAGEVIIVERSGKPVAQLTRLPRPGLSTAELIERMRHLPPVDYDAMRRELDEILDPSL
ncbi:type II toxin-antitoxin system Phd/YefM family antitoxin [Aeromicrobium sp.]|uniref:type II toxin-antitoxin system Phd/YefM family antitoxin n=1 Tax=Aeromicrobium sp. TaxID=1871063 RepID=UPI003D6B0A60